MAAFWTVILGILILAAAIITMGLIIAWKIGHALTEYDDYDIDKSWVYEPTPQTQERALNYWRDRARAVERRNDQLVREIQQLRAFKYYTKHPEEKTNEDKNSKTILK